MGKVTMIRPAEDPDAVLEQAIGNYDNVLIIGWDKGGMLDVRADLDLTNERCLWLIKAFENKLINGDYEDD